MRNRSLTFQRSLFFSAGAHVLIFGTALAFAQYSTAMFGGGFRSITVSLVDEGKAGAGGGRGIPAARTPAPANTPAPDLPVKGEGPASTAMVDREEAASATNRGEGPGPGTGGAEQIAGSGSGPGNSIEGSGAAFSLEQWQHLRAAIEKAKTYPRMARERGIEGTVVIRFKVLPSGEIATVSVVQSSGAAVLDEASIRAIYRAAPVPYVNGWVEVPISYVLK
jgi:TonB family protein